MKSIKLSKHDLDRMILSEMYGMGLASFKPSITKPASQPSIEEPSEPITPENPLRVGVQNVFGEIELLEIDNAPPQSHKTEQAIRTFQRFYRTLDTDTRYFFQAWLREKLVKNLSVSEAAHLSSTLNASSKAYTEPKNPNK